MKKIKNILNLVLVVGLINCSNQKKDNNSIFNKQYNDIKEFECFNKYEKIGGAIISENKEFDFGISEIKENNLDIILFEKVYTGSKPVYEILDTIHIRNKKDTEYISYKLCRKDSISDCEIIALVIFEDVEFYTSVIKAWRANRKTGKIIEIDTKGIDCLNEGYGV